MTLPNVIRKWRDGIDVRLYADGTFDASSLATAFNKKTYEYLRLQRTIEYIDELATELKLPSGLDEESVRDALVVTLRGGPNQGTRFHPRLMIDYGRWLSPKFAVWLDAWVFELITSSRTPAPTADEPVEMMRPDRLYHQQAVLINETDLHQTVVRAIRARWPTALFTAGLGELQNTPEQRIEAWRKGYLKGQPDLLIFEKTSEHAGLALEFKSPGNAVVAASEAQEATLLSYRCRGWKTLVSNDYTEILLEVADYLREAGRRCECCAQLFVSDELLKHHLTRKRRRASEAVASDPGA